MAVEGGARLWTHAPSTMLRMVPLPRCTGEDKPTASARRPQAPPQDAEQEAEGAT